MRPKIRCDEKSWKFLRTKQGLVFRTRQGNAFGWHDIRQRPAWLCACFEKCWYQRPNLYICFFPRERDHTRIPLGFFDWCHCNFKFGNVPLLFTYSEGCHYNSLAPWKMPCYTSLGALGPDAVYGISSIFVWTILPPTTSLTLVIDMWALLVIPFLCSYQWWFSFPSTPWLLGLTSTLAEDQ